MQKIKNTLGSTNAYYLKLSTQIVGNALHNIVEEVNAVQQGNVIELDNGLSFDIDTLMSPEARRAKYNRIKSTVREAWNATTLMDEFDMEVGFKSHYNENRNTLKSMCNQMGVSTYVSRPAPIQPNKTSSSSSETNSSTVGNPNGNGEEKVGLVIFIIAIIVLLIIIFSSIY